METMTLERQHEQDVAESLAPELCPEQLELELGLTLEERRQLNANAIMRTLELRKHVAVETSLPCVCGIEAANLAARIRRSE